MRGLLLALFSILMGACTCAPGGERTKKLGGRDLEDEPNVDPVPRRDVIYLVTLESKLLAFDPEKPGMSAYSAVGDLDCNRYSSPQSMAVDRNGIAWVFYSSGHLYWVSTADASCQGTKYVHPSGNTQLGMAFTSDRPNAPEETLYIASPSLGFATLDTTSLRVRTIDAAPVKGELAGGADAKLFMFTPTGYGEYGASRLDEVDRRSYEPGLAHRMKSQTPLQAWAFARYGGLFYIFTSEFGEPSKCTVVDVEGKIERVRDADIGYRIVGAGQSTLVPQRDTGAPLRGDPPPSQSAEEDEPSVEPPQRVPPPVRVPPPREPQKPGLAL